MQDITQELVERLMKESRLPRKPKKLPEPVTGWKQNESGGGRHYQIALHGETLSEIGVEIERQAKAENVLPQKIVAEAVRLRAEYKAASPGEYVMAQMEEFQERIGELRELSIKNQQLEIRLDAAQRRIAELEELRIPILESENSEGKQVFFWSDVETWEQVAAIVDCDRTRLLSAVKAWSTSKRQNLARMLSEFLSREPQALEQAGSINWIPEKLLHSALKYLSFAVQTIDGGNNLIESPEIKWLKGCKFASLSNFGNRWEQWVFESPEGKRIPVFGRNEFVVES